MSVPFLQLISRLTVDRILIKLGEYVGTSVRLIVLRFHCATPVGLCATQRTKGDFFFHLYAFQSILRHTSFLNFRAREAQNPQAKQARCECEYAAPDCDTSDSDLLVCIHLNLCEG